MIAFLLVDYWYCFQTWREHMTTAKEEMVDIISRQPDDSSYDALLRELAYARMIQRGLQDAAKGRVNSDADVKKSIDSWLK